MQGLVFRPVVGISCSLPNVVFHERHTSCRKLLLLPLDETPTLETTSDVIARIVSWAGLTWGILNIRGCAIKYRTSREYFGEACNRFEKGSIRVAVYRVIAFHEPVTIFPPFYPPLSFSQPSLRSLFDRPPPSPSSNFTSFDRVTLPIALSSSVQRIWQKGFKRWKTAFRTRKNSFFSSATKLIYAIPLLSLLHLLFSRTFPSFRWIPRLARSIRIRRRCSLISSGVSRNCGQSNIYRCLARLMGLVGEQCRRTMSRLLARAKYLYIRLCSGFGRELPAREKFTERKKLVRELSRYYETIAPCHRLSSKHLFQPSGNFVSL